MKLTVVIPMAGLGSRFAKAGFGVPKPLIRFNGKMMVEHVLDSFREASCGLNFVLILRDDFVKHWESEIKELQRHNDVSFITVKKVTQGAACTVMLARDAFEGGSLLVADSDTFYDPIYLKGFFEHLKTIQPSQSVVTFNSDKPCYSYINIDGGKVDIAEKRVISNHAISGIYYFRYSSDFLNAAIDAMIYGERDNGEFYMSKIFHIAAQKNLHTITYFEIEENGMFCTGTPEQLNNVMKRLEV